jgi:hypothetical protein
MTLAYLLHFFRFKVLHISTKYIWLEKKMLGKDMATPFNHLIGMVSNEIRNYCYKYGRDTYTGEGTLIDLGSWLGSTVVPLAAGLSQNEKAKGNTIHAYDAFVWYENMTHSARYSSIRNKYKVGDDFLPEFERQTAAYAAHITIHKGNLADVAWDKSPVEYMMIDAMKDWEVALRIVREFYPCLIPGKAIIIHEDFCHHYTSWIHLIQYRLRDYFKPLNAIPNSTAVVFRLVRSLPPLHELLPENFTDFSDDEIEAAFDYSLSLVEPFNHPAVYAAKAIAYRHKKNYKKAIHILSNLPFVICLLDREVKDALKTINNEF